MKIAFTGQMYAGKDFTAAAIGGNIISIAEPIYALTKHYFGTADKSVPGIREFMQKVGGWGRGVFDEEHPATPERALFIELIRAPYSPLLHTYPEILWGDFGRDSDFWLRHAGRRADEIHDGIVCVVGARMDNEREFFRTNGWTMVHVTCRPETQSARAAAIGVKGFCAGARRPHWESCLSERYAISLDRLIDAGDFEPALSRSHFVVWNDDAPKPCDRFYTVEEFKANVASRRGWESTVAS